VPNRTGGQGKRQSTASAGSPAFTPPGAPESRQAEKKQTHKQTKTSTIAYNTTVDIDDLKPQDNTSTA